MEKIKQPKSLLSRKEEVYVLKEDKENVLDSHQRANNADQLENQCVSRPLSMKQAVKIMHISSAITTRVPTAGEKIHWNKQHFGTT